MNNQIANLENNISEELRNDKSIKTYFLKENSTLPLVIKNKNEDQKLENWFSANKKHFDLELLKYGAILCKGFNVNTVEKFQNLTKTFTNDLLDYKMRSSPRYEITSNVYVSTTYPKEEHINMHSESSYAPSHPTSIVFCCVTPATVKGETPIADNRLILKNMDKTLVHKFKNKGVMYKRNLTGFLGMTWEEVFQTSDRKEVEAECIKSGIQYKWISNSHLEMTWTKKAIWEHPITGEIMWFNHAMFFNKYSFNEDLLSFISSDDELPNNTFFGDGTQITKEEIMHIKEVYNKATIEFPWEEGDVLFLDNMLTSHSRNPYEGDRKIIVSIS